MFRFRNLLFLFVLSLVIYSCEGLKNSAINIFESSERARYERSFPGSDSLLSNWKNAYETAKSTNLQIEDGFNATARKDSTDTFALAYTLELKKGENLVVEIENANQYKFFVDIIDNSQQPESISQLLEYGKYSSFVRNSGKHTVIIQPEIQFQGNFSFKIYTQPSIGFPVAGKGNRDIQSFWGANRDGGARRHEGVDIFAKRGTPVVAAVDGRISRTGNTGLGGKQVWLRDGILGNSLYYAHLDSIMVQSGTSVKIGDTLGTVGSTGNAEGGAPHLHFGIYSVGGAVDPYPYIRKRSVPHFRKGSFQNSGKILAGRNLRLGPGLDYTISTELKNSISTKVLAAAGDWLHIQTEAGQEGFISKSRILRGE